jgi:hypothetical protein
MKKEIDFLKEQITKYQLDKNYRYSPNSNW